jgi:hypothetical protein
MCGCVLDGVSVLVRVALFAGRSCGSQEIGVGSVFLHQQKGIAIQIFF